MLVHGADSSLRLPSPSTFPQNCSPSSPSWSFSCWIQFTFSVLFLVILSTNDVLLCDSLLQDSMAESPPRFSPVSTRHNLIPPPQVSHVLTCPRILPWDLSNDILYWNSQPVPRFYLGSPCYIMCESMLSRFSRVWLFATLWTAACQTPLSMGFSRQEYLERVAMPFSRGSSWPRDGTRVS